VPLLPALLRRLLRRRRRQLTGHRRCRAGGGLPAAAPQLTRNPSVAAVQDAVSICDMHGTEFARGLTNFDCEVRSAGRTRRPDVHRQYPTRPSTATLMRTVAGCVLLAMPASRGTLFLPPDIAILPACFAASVTRSPEGCRL
jgi:hypothetical protein